ncbi:DUF3631 domain-containing protein [Propionivibrio sp.]|uniref:DUF3631 domain-containing protein n=1 Tax=Propionivibrio sp. TaxID=2212460 RepID=UPI003BF3A251
MSQIQKLLPNDDFVACPADHPYLVATGNVGANCQMYNGDAVVADIPCRGLATFKICDHSGKPANALFLANQGDSSFEHVLLTGDSIAGHYIRIGSLTNPILVVEDVESGLSLNAATDFCVAVTLYSENIAGVVSSLRKKYPESRIIVCVGAYGAKDLRSNEPYARKAAMQSHAGVAIPDSGDHFNDLFLERGAKHTLAQVLLGNMPLTKPALPEPEESSPVTDSMQWSGPIFGSALMEQLLEPFKRHVVLSEHQILAVSLWVILTHAVGVARVLPILALVSPVRRCGKTTLLGLILMLVNRGLMSNNITPAAMYRTVDEWKPTLLIDEADTFLATCQELIGIINAGHTRDSGFVYRMGVGNKPRRFNVFCPKLIAGIGHRSPTITDRSIVIEHQRKREDEIVEKYSAKDNDDLVALRTRIARWAADNLEAIAAAQFDRPALGNDRALDNWEPLLAIAACLGDEWLKAATEAAEALSATHEKAICSGEELLRDIRTVFSAKGTNRIYTSKLIHALCSNPEKPWSTFSRGGPITPRQIGKLLDDFGIESRDIRTGEEVKKGYWLVDFEDAFARYVPD